MKTTALQPTSPWRIFGASGILTVAGLVGVLLFKGFGAMLVAAVLIAVEVAFSFDNAVLNAKVLANLSRFWQTMFLTVGALIAVFGMRIVFPLLVVVVTAGLGWGQVLDLALHHPAAYAVRLQEAHVALSAF